LLRLTSKFRFYLYSHNFKRFFNMKKQNKGTYFIMMKTKMFFKILFQYSSLTCSESKKSCPSATIYTINIYKLPQKVCKNYTPKAFKILHMNNRAHLIDGLIAAGTMQSIL